MGVLHCVRLDDQQKLRRMTAPAPAAPPPSAVAAQPKPAYVRPAPGSARVYAAFTPDVVVKVNSSARRDKQYFYKCVGWVTMRKAAK
jgi:hypothetical protein